MDMLFSEDMQAESNVSGKNNVSGKRNVLGQNKMAAMKGITSSLLENWQKVLMTIWGKTARVAKIMHKLY